MILLSVLRKKTKRNYLDCVNGFPKAKATRVVKQLVMITGMGHVSMAMEDTNMMVDGGLGLKV